MLRVLIGFPLAHFVLLLSRTWSCFSGFRAPKGRSAVAVLLRETEGFIIVFLRFAHFFDFEEKRFSPLRWSWKMFIFVFEATIRFVSKTPWFCFGSLNIIFEQLERLPSFTISAVFALRPWLGLVWGGEQGGGGSKTFFAFVLWFHFQFCF